MKRPYRRPLLGALCGATIALCACSKNQARDPNAAPATVHDQATGALPAQKPAPQAPPAKELRILHMRDHLMLATQARDALIRGQLVEATGALTWLAQHREPNATPRAEPFLERLHQHAQRALDSSDLRTAAEAIGGLAATCGECHAMEGRRPEREPSGFEDLEDALTVTTHMHGYLWATDTLWNALVSDSTLWGTGVATLATLTPPRQPHKLAAGFAAVQAWAKTAGAAATASARGQAYGELLAVCGTCHLANAVVPGAAP